MASGVFYPKKAKVELRNKRRRKEKLLKSGTAEDDGNIGVVASKRFASSPQNMESAGSPLSITMMKNVSGGSSSGRKRTADQMLNIIPPSSSTTTKAEKETTAMTTIVIPRNLTAKDAKKFRKDERRKARLGGIAEDRIEFIVEGKGQKKSSKSSSAVSAEKCKEQDRDDAHEKKEYKKVKENSSTNKKASYPRINDLLTQHATHQKLQDKLAKQKSINDTLSPTEKQKYVALDCEMVGIGPDGKKSALARVSVVDWESTVLLDTFVRVPERVTDFRTKVSGVRAKDIAVKNENAMNHDEVRLAVGNILQNKILVGHALKNDLSVLLLSHPRKDIRDTARYKPFMRPSGTGGGKMRPRKLRDLVLENLGRHIQIEGVSHCSIDDAVATMNLFQIVRAKWEKELQQQQVLGGKKKKMSTTSA
jgi:RNA exonuclease 4